MTNDDDGTVYATDGSSTLFVLSGETLEVARMPTVVAAGRPISGLNDVQWVRGEIWANIWHEDRKGSGHEPSILSTRWFRSLHAASRCLL